MSYPNPTLSRSKPLEGKGILEAEIFVSELSNYEQLIEFARVSGFNHALYMASNKVSNEKDAIAILELMEKPKTESVTKHIPYEYIETVNGMEVFIENPKMPNATSLEDDLREHLKRELKENGVSFDNLIINFYEPK